MHSQNSQHDRNGSPDYVSYLVRLCRAHSGQGQRDPQWKASLEEPLTREILRFESLQSLFAFLLAQTGQQGQQAGNGKRDVRFTFHERQMETS